MPVELMGDFFNRRLDSLEERMLASEGAEYFYSLSASLLPSFGGAKLLDLGCGTGLELDFYFRLHPEANVSVTCVDLADELMAVLKKKHENRDITLIHDSYFDVDFGKNSFDGIISVESLHHFTREKKVALYKRILDALVPGGIYVETDYVAKTEEIEKEKYEEALRRRREAGVPDDVFVHLDTPHTKEHLLEMYKEAGFDDIKCLYDEDVAVFALRKAK